jgi:hypothetical protein
MLRRFHPDRPARRLQAWPTPALLLVAALATACVPVNDEGRFDLENVQRHEECLQEVFPFEPTFLAAHNSLDSVGLLMQSQARLTQSADYVYIEIFEPGQVAAGSPTTFTFGYPTDAETPARAEVALRESCPQLNVSLAIRGKVTLERLDTDSGGRVIGQLTEGTVIDARSGEVVAGSITGSWDFTSKVTAPWRNYPTYDDEEYLAEPFEGGE